MTTYQGYCGFCEHFRGRLVGQCKYHPPLTIVHRTETCDEGVLSYNVIMQLVTRGEVSL